MVVAMVVDPDVEQPKKDGDGWRLGPKTWDKTSLVACASNPAQAFAGFCSPGGASRVSAARCASPAHPTSIGEAACEKARKFCHLSGVGSHKLLDEGVGEDQRSGRRHEGPTCVLLKVIADEFSS